MKINAVFEGGGVKAIGLAGAVAAAQERGVIFEHVAGTSSGAIVASMLAAGYRGSEMKSIIEATPFRSFLRRTWLHRVRLIGPALRVYLRKGLYAGEGLEHWIYQILRAKGVRTFGDLPPGVLKIIASDISQGRLMVLPDDLEQYGLNSSTFPVSKAIRMSTSIPYFFDPVILRKGVSASKGLPFKDQLIYVVDGGILSNFPLWLFDQERETEKEKQLPTIGFQLVGRGDHQPREIIGPLSMLQALFSTMMDAHDERYIEDYNRFRTVKIPTLGVHTTDFSISKEKSMDLYHSGEKASAKFFDRWSLNAYQAASAQHRPPAMKI